MCVSMGGVMNKLAVSVEKKKYFFLKIDSFMESVCLTPVWDKSCSMWLGLSMFLFVWMSCLCLASGIFSPTCCLTKPRLGSHTWWTTSWTQQVRTRETPWHDGTLNYSRSESKSAHHSSQVMTRRALNVSFNERTKMFHDMYNCNEYNLFCGDHTRAIRRESVVKHKHIIHTGWVWLEACSLLDIL